MTELVLTSPIRSITYGRHINMSAYGGTPPYQYSVKRNGAGGSVVPLEDGSVTYFAPLELPSNGICVDQINVVDAENNKASTSIIVGDYITIFCDVIAHEMDLYDRVFIASQKFEWPKDDKLFIVVDVATTRLIGNNVEYRTINSIYSEVKTINSCATFSINAYSRSLEALHRFPQILSAFSSAYGQEQQVRNGIRISTLPNGPLVNNLSELDGSSMLYRFHMNVSVFHNDQTIKAVDYFDSYQLATKVNA